MISVGRNEVYSEGFVLKPFLSGDIAFDCVKKDLNDFFLNDAIPHDKQLLTKTYFLIPEGGDISFPKALISYCNDSIRIESFEEEKDFKRLLRKIPQGKRYRSLPSVKIARLGVHKDYQRSGVGSLLLNMTKLFFLTQNRTGCRYLTVDAYKTKQAIGFYKKNHFLFLQKKDEAWYNGRYDDPRFAQEDSDETVGMYYNLIWSSDSIAPMTAVVP